MKYYIENESGEWMTCLEEPGPAWTRDPLKAWTFVLSDEGVFSIVGTTLMPTEMNSVLTFLRSEDLGPLAVVHYDFIEMWDAQHLRDSNGDLWIDMRGDRQFKRLNNISGPVISRGGFQYTVST